MSGPPRVSLLMTTNAGDVRRAIAAGLMADPKHVPPPVAAPPDLTGPEGQAWRFDLAGVRDRLGVKPEDDGSVAMWAVRAPWANPLWFDYAVTLIHLRPMPDGRPTRIYLAGATHEVWVYAVDPEARIDGALFGDYREAWAKRWLNPKQFASQFIAADDDAAIAKVEAAVKEIIAGKLSPDVDGQRDWQLRFGRNMMKGEYL